MLQTKFIAEKVQRADFNQFSCKNINVKLSVTNTLAHGVSVMPPKDDYLCLLQKLEEAREKFII